MRLSLLDFLLLFSFIPHRRVWIQLHNFLLSIAAPSRTARSLPGQFADAPAVPPQKKQP